MNLQMCSIPFSSYFLIPMLISPTYISDLFTRVFGKTIIEIVCVFSVSHKDMEYLKRLKDFYNDQLIYKNNGSTMGLKLNKKNACSPISIEEKQTLVKPKDFVDDYVLIEKQFNCYRKVGAASALVLYFKDDFKFGFHILSISLVIDSLIEERYTIDGANICKWNTDLIPLFERSLLQRSNCSHSWNTDLRILVLSVLFYLILL
ncbi:uncharacterized protein [Lepeophtheirus salmonis]|uniref:uncharacterized protein isoform X4 n=1 Tax=Lepeophtheirus salmonis TaxID=72036 RepID=UPI001AEB9E0B|nr:uncharacterized protein LOC121130596 isoform X4 [Lepeophtheirus salmonis]